MLYRQTLRHFTVILSVSFWLTYVLIVSCWFVFGRRFETIDDIIVCFTYSLLATLPTLWIVAATITVSARLADGTAWAIFWLAALVMLLIIEVGDWLGCDLTPCPKNCRACHRCPSRTW